MIQANELRVGNWISNGDPIRFEFFMAGGNLDGDYIDYDPIPLTPEILEKCGFRLNAWGYLMQDPAVEFGISIDSLQPINYYGSRLAATEIKHLHQLQNLYFALTNKELEVNL